MSFASKKLTTEEENTEAIDQNLQMLEEEVMYKSKSWAHQAEEEEEEYDSNKKYEEDEDEHISKRCADQVESEEGNEVESMDSYASIDNPTTTQNSNTPNSKAATGKKKKEQQIHNEATGRHDEQATKSATVLETKKGLSPNADAFVPTGQKQNAAIVSNF